MEDVCQIQVHSLVFPSRSNVSFPRIYIYIYILADAFTR